MKTKDITVIPMIISTLKKNNKIKTIEKAMMKIKNNFNIQNIKIMR